MTTLKVLMMGGRRCGKTSALASLFDQMINGKTNQFLTVCDNTILETKILPNGGEEKQDKLSNKKLELKDFISKGGHSVFLVDKGPTRNYWLYKLQLQLPGTTKRMYIEFRDSAGEFFDAGGAHHNETVEYIKDCDVFVIMVDTPYLMAGSQVENEAANVIDSIHTFMTQIENDNGRKAKQVIFVPIKCEKWIQEEKINEVCTKVETVYETTLTALNVTNKTEISIIPIQTAGDILFSELRAPYIIYNKMTQSKKKCSKISDKLVILENGKNYKLSADEILNDDPEGVFPESDIMRPAAWYHLPYNREAQYTPQNCEQLPLHILRFMLNKAKSEKVGGIFPDWFINLFGQITVNDLQTTLDKISKNGLIKDSGEGIKRVKQCF